VYPGLYTGRTRHIHVKVQPPGGPTLTTQLYFPGEARNASDSIFTLATLVSLTRGRPAWTASFDFVVAG
jgi:protocatechuate 3,4-dioxygenase beta subunit